MSPSDRIDQLRAETEYRRQRLELYRAKVGGSHPTTPERLAELEHEYDLAASRLQRARQEAAGAEREKPQRDD